MRAVLASITLALVCVLVIAPAAATADSVAEGEPSAVLQLHPVPDAPTGDAAWVMPKKMRRMRRTSSEEAVSAVPEPSAALVFGAGVLIAASRLRRRRGGEEA